MKDRHSGPLGVFGGTFDPVHNAHVALAMAALAQLRLDAVLWIPAGNPPHRATPQVDGQHRLAMVKRAIGDEPRFMLDASEVGSSATSYTVDTLSRLGQIHGLRPLMLLLGADAFLGLAHWHQWRNLFGLAHIAVATRPGYMLDENAMEPPLAAEFRSRHTDDVAALAQRHAGCIVSFAIPALDISASAIRTNLAAGRSVRGLLPDGVLDYIAANHLYSDHENRH